MKGGSISKRKQKQENANKKGKILYEQSYFRRNQAKTKADVLHICCRKSRQKHWQRGHFLERGKMS